MGIGYRIKEARERMGLTQTELGALIGVTGSAITNYEKEASHPKEQIIYKLMETLNVDANYLFQDAVKIKAKLNDVTLAEYDHIKKYRALDEHGKKMVDFVLAEESDRCSASIDHFRGNFMDGIQTWPADLAKVPSNRISIPNDTAWLSAAHNDHASDPEEQEKMQTDMKLLKRPEK